MTRKLITHSWIVAVVLVAACDPEKSPLRPEPGPDAAADSAGLGSAQSLQPAQTAALRAALEDACERVTGAAPDSPAARQLRQAVHTLAEGLARGDLSGTEPAAELARHAAAAVPDAAPADLDALTLGLDLLDALLTHPAGAPDAAQR